MRYGFKGVSHPSTAQRAPPPSALGGTEALSHSQDESESELRGAPCDRLDGRRSQAGRVETRRRHLNQSTHLTTHLSDNCLPLLGRRCETLSSAWLRPTTGDQLRLLASLPTCPTSSLVTSRRHPCRQPAYRRSIQALAHRAGRCPMSRRHRSGTIGARSNQMHLVAAI